MSKNKKNSAHQDTPPNESWRIWRSILRGLQKSKNRSFERSTPISRENGCLREILREKLYRTYRFSASGALPVTGYVNFAKKRPRFHEIFLGATFDRFCSMETNENQLYADAEAAQVKTVAETSRRQNTRCDARSLGRNARASA